MRILFVEPPKDFWFIMGEYLPPPYGILQLAAFLESKNKEVEIEVLDCQAERLDWKGLERRIESFNPDVVACSGLSTCNTYTIAQTCSIVKKVRPDALTVVGGQHFTVMAQKSLKAYPEIDVIVRGEGEQTFVELVNSLIEKTSFLQVKGISFRHDGNIINNPERPLIENLDDLPYPGYHFVKDFVHKYHFTMMAVLLPKECSKIFFGEKDITQEKSISSNNASFIFGLRIVHGHHHSCKNFSSHEFRIKDKTFCAGCTGLLIGALISLFGAIIYFSSNLSIPTFFIIIGLLGVAIGLILPLLNLKQTILRLLINAFFIFGVFLMLIGIDALVQSIFVDLFLISLSIFWLFTRISFSQWNHRRICYECENKCRLKAV